MNQLQIASRNVKLYIFVKIFAKRVFLPLTAIYFLDTANFSLRDIGLLSGFFSIIQLFAEVPTGYFADKIGRVASIRMGALCAAIATTFYVIFHHKTGIYAGVIFEAIGYSFMGGAGEAMIHDSLIVMNQEHEYTKILSRTMSISLIANAVLIALVPMTYRFDVRWPFIIGTIAYLLLFTVTLFMKDVERQATNIPKQFPDFGKIIGRKNILIFGLTFGIISALFTAPADMVNVALREFGVRADLIGWIYGIASVVGAILGYFIHYLRKIRLSRYLLIDLFFLLILFFAAYTRNYIFLGLTMITSISFWRYRRIIYQDYLLNIFPTGYKATLISAMNNLEQLNSIWLPIAISTIITFTDTSTGFGIVGLFALFISPIFYWSTLKFFNRDPIPIDLAQPSLDVV